MKSTKWVKCLAVSAMVWAPANIALAQMRPNPQRPLALTLPLSPAQEAALKQRAKMEAAGISTPPRAAPVRRRAYSQRDYSSTANPAYPRAGSSTYAAPTPYGLHGYSVVGEVNNQARRPR